MDTYSLAINVEFDADLPDVDAIRENTREQLERFIPGSKVSVKIGQLRWFELDNWSVKA